MKAAAHPESVVALTKRIRELAAHPKVSDETRDWVRRRLLNEGMRHDVLFVVLVHLKSVTGGRPA